MTPEQAMTILEHISAAYARFEITEKRVEVWLEHLMEMPYEKVLARLKAHIKQKPFPPSIAEISVYVTPKNEFLAQYDQWKQEGAARIAKQRRDERGQSEQPRADK